MIPDNPTDSDRRERAESLRRDAEKLEAAGQHRLASDYRAAVERLTGEILPPSDDLPVGSLNPELWMAPQLKRRV